LHETKENRILQDGKRVKRQYMAAVSYLYELETTGIEHTGQEKRQRYHVMVHANDKSRDLTELRHGWMWKQ
jgi:hypothetical protein